MSEACNSNDIRVNIFGILGTGRGLTLHRLISDAWQFLWQFLYLWPRIAAGGTILGLCLMPQVYHAFRTKSVDGGWIIVNMLARHATRLPPILLAGSCLCRHLACLVGQPQLQQHIPCHSGSMGAHTKLAILQQGTAVMIQGTEVQVAPCVHPVGSLIYMYGIPDPAGQYCTSLASSCTWCTWCTSTRWQATSLWP